MHDTFLSARERQAGGNRHPPISSACGGCRARARSVGIRPSCPSPKDSPPISSAIFVGQPET
jgi:hypothetical protein